MLYALATVIGNCGMRQVRLSLSALSAMTNAIVKYPNREVVGLCYGICRGNITDIQQMAIQVSPWEDRFCASAAIRHNGVAFCAVIHSHPLGHLFPSLSDIVQMRKLSLPWVIGVIIDLKVHYAAFVCVDDALYRMQLTVWRGTPSSGSQSGLHF